MRVSIQLSWWLAATMTMALVAADGTVVSAQARGSAIDVCALLPREGGQQDSGPFHLSRATVTARR